jgi:hypothetical protein
MPIADGAAPTVRGRVRSAADWRLDDDTRRVGRQGIAAARAQLAATAARTGGHPIGGDHERTGRAA